MFRVFQRERIHAIRTGDAYLQHPIYLPWRGDAQPHNGPSIPDEMRDRLREHNTASAIQPYDGVLEGNGDGLGEVKRK